MSDKIYYVYAYVRLDTNTYFYIGKGKGDRCYRLDNRSKHFSNIVNFRDCVVEILYDNLTEDEAFGLEIYTIHDLVFNEGYSIELKDWDQTDKHLVNQTWGGEGTSGLSVVQSPETIAKRVSKTTGQKRTPEQVSNISNGVKNFLENNEEALNNFRYAWLGRSRSQEQKDLQSRIMSGRTLTEDHKKSISGGLNRRSQEEKAKANAKRSATEGTPMYCIELDMKFTSIRNIERYFINELGIGFNRKVFRKVLNGTHKNNWYKEIEINGVVTQLHWIKLDK